MIFNYFNKVLFTLCFIWFAGSASAAKMTYDVIDLSDNTVGEDLWQYSYSVSDYVFDAGYGFSIFFDDSLYSKLDNSSAAVNFDWDILTFQPDNTLPDAGVYDALALSNGASLTMPFTVDFVWIGNGVPGVQPFDVYDESFDIVISGFTSPVPEPASLFLLLMGTGLMVFFAFKRNRLSNGHAVGEKS